MCAVCDSESVWKLRHVLALVSLVVSGGDIILCHTASMRPYNTALPFFLNTNKKCYRRAVCNRRSMDDVNQ